MNIVLVTRCGCRSTQSIEASEAPPGIQMELDVPEGYPQTIRRFSFVGNHQIHDLPVYLEDLPEVVEEDKEIIVDAVDFTLEKGSED